MRRFDVPAGLLKSRSKAEDQVLRSPDVQAAERLLELKKRPACRDLAKSVHVACHDSMPAYVVSNT